MAAAQVELTQRSHRLRVSIWYKTDAFPEATPVETGGVEVNTEDEERSDGTSSVGFTGQFLIKHR